MPKNENSRYKSAFKFLFKFIKPHRKLYLIAVVISVIIIGVNLLQTYTTQQLIDHSISGNANRVILSIIVFLLIVFLNASLSWCSKVSVGKLSSLCGRDIKRYIANRLINADYKEVIKLKSGDMLNTLNNDTKAVTDFVSDDLVNLFSQFAMAIAAFIYLLLLNPLLCFVTFLYTPIGMFFTLSLNKKLNKLYPQNSDYKGEALSVVEQALSCIPVIKSFVMHKQFINKVRNAYGKVYKNDMQIAVYNALMQPACYSTSWLPRLIYLIFAGRMVMNDSLSIGVFIAVYNLLNFIIGPSVYFPFLLNGLNKSIASINRIIRIENLTQVVKKELRQQLESEPSIDVKNVSFSYLEDTPVLTNVSFEVCNSGIVALKGESGSGKTTMLDLLCGLHATQEGYMNLLGLNPSEIDISSLISVVSQDIYLFPVSIKENIRFAKSDASDTEIENASKLVGADEFVNQLEKGYDTVVGDGKASLSGGQKQRIALAQTILKNAPIWLLDEPTAALDSETESIIINTIKKASKNKIIIVSTHRQALLDIADRVITFERQV